MNVKIRKYKNTDYEGILKLASRLVIGMPDWRSKEKMEEFMRSAIIEDIHKIGKDCQIFVAYKDKVVGFVSIYKHQNFTGEEEAYIGEIVVDSGNEGQGIGRVLLEKSEDWAKERGYSLLVLETGANNIRAINFYKLHSYEEESVKLTKKLAS